MAKNLKTFIGALPIIAKAIGRRYGVRIKIGGNQASTNGKTITLPSLPADDPEVEVLVNGYLDHEAAHCRFTDFKVQRSRQPFQNWLENTMEDIRIELAMGQHYPGCRKHLAEIEAKLVRDGVDGPVPDDAPAAAVLSGYIYFRLRDEVLGQDSVSHLSQQARGLLEARFPDDLCTRLDQAMFEIRDATSTQDAIGLAARIFEMFKEEAQEPPPDNGPGDPGDQGDPGESGEASAQAREASSEAEDPSDEDDRQKGGSGADSREEDEGEERDGKDGSDGRSTGTGAKDEETEDDGRGAEDEDDPDEGESESDTGAGTEPDDDEGQEQDTGGESTQDEGDPDEDEPDASAGADPDNGRDNEDDGRGAEDEDDPDEGESESDTGAGTEPDDDEGQEQDTGGESTQDEGDPDEDEPDASAGADPDNGRDKDQAGSENDSQSEEARNRRQQLRKAMEDDADELKQAIGDQVARLLEQKAVEGDAQEVAEAEDDAGNGAGGPNGRLSFGAFIDEAKVRRESARLRSRLAGLVQTETLTQSHRSRTGRRIDRRALPRLRLADPRVFRAERDEPGVDTAVTILLDRSGSMLGRPVAIAREAALATAYALDEIQGVNPSVFAFPGADGADGRVSTLHRRGRRVDAKRFGIEVAGCTPLTEAAWFAGWDLLTANEPRKILIVLTDGVPDDMRSAIDVFGRMRASGIETLGIGIDIDIHRKLMPESRKIDDVSGLSVALFSLLERKLVTEVAA